VCVDFKKKINGRTDANVLKVMVTVAKNFDAPIKVLFPRDLLAEEYKFTLLGLGDIVVPGLFITLALCFDYSHGQGKAKFAKPYFTVCMLAYIVGLITTVTVMQVFQAAQVLERKKKSLLLVFNNQSLARFAVSQPCLHALCRHPGHHPW